VSPSRSPAYPGSRRTSRPWRAFLWTTGQAFLQAVLEDPGETNRLFADWLHEHGEEEPARWFRQARGPVEVAWAVIHDWLAGTSRQCSALLNGGGTRPPRATEGQIGR